MTRVVYLAGPIDFANLGEHKNWRYRVGDAYLRDLCLYNPLGAFLGDPTSVPAALRHINQQALRACDGLLAAVFPEQPSWGTPLEIADAERMCKPVVLWTPTGQVPAYLDLFPAHVDLEDACAHLRHLLEILDVEPRTEPEGIPESRLIATVSAITEPRYSGDVGYDLTLSEDVSLRPGGFARLPIGIYVGAPPEWASLPLKLAIPDGHWGSVLPRSSMVAKGVMVQPTVIDPGYRGPIYIFCLYAGDEPLALKAGDRVAQLVLYRAETPPLHLSNTLPGSERGQNGFGSTGR